MYLYLGEETVVSEEKIIGIFDIENTSVGKITKEFLSGKSFNVVNVSYNLPKSFILCSDINTKSIKKQALKNAENKKNFTIYITNISPATLKKRVNIYNLYK